MARLNIPRLPFRLLLLPPKPRFLHGIPNNSLLAISLLLAANALVWAACAVVVLRLHPKLISPAALSYSLGLRHALDADHISAIDLVTRRLLAAGQRPATVGTFFSLGHSTVVVVTCVVVAATSGALRDRFDGFARVGNIVGTSVSAAFLVLLCLGNAWVLYKLVTRLRQLLAERHRRRRRREEAGGDAADADAAPVPTEYDAEATASGQFNLEGGGLMARVLGFLFRAIDRPWKMYPLGVVFGLGFDTSSEIAILGIASIQAVQGTSIWLILIFPILFTSGMCLLDTTDGALMMALYSSKAFSRDVVAILYYSIVLTGITVFVAAFIGIIQILSLVQNVAEPEGSFWDGVSAITDHFEIVGGSIVGLFVVVGVGSILVYRPWRRRMDRKRHGMAASADAGLRDAEDSEAPLAQETTPRHLID